MEQPNFRVTYESSKHIEFSFDAHSTVLKAASAVFRDRFDSGKWVSLFRSDGYNDSILTPKYRSLVAAALSYHRPKMSPTP